MQDNPILEAMLRRKSIRKYTSQIPPDDIITSVVRAGQQAAFASQLGSIMLSRDGKKHPLGAPLLFTILVDLHKMELIMAQRNWKMVTNDLSMLLFGIQDASLMAENMVIAAESLGMGSCFLGMIPYAAAHFARKHKLPRHVFPLVQLAMGYPDEDPPPRPRYPMDFVLFEDEYPEFNEQTVKEAMKVMDDGYMAQSYYRDANLMIPLEGDREETYSFDTYGWTEHISRKWGQWNSSVEELLEQFAECGFSFTDEKERSK